MSSAKPLLCLLAVMAAYGIAGRLDYEGALMLEETERQPLVIATDNSAEGATHEASMRRPRERENLDQALLRDATTCSTSALAPRWPAHNR